MKYMKSEQVDPTCETVYHTVAHERTVSDGGGGGHGGRTVQHHRVKVDPEKIFF